MRYLININEAIIVEGKYDKIKISNIVNTLIVKTEGFKIFKDKQKLDLIRQLAENTGIIVLTDSDAAGFLIRNYIKSSVTTGVVKHAYIPDVKGKEKRKKTQSKEGKLGVEGIDDTILLSAIKKCIDSGEFKERACKFKISKVDLYNAGLVGHECSKKLRKSLFLELNLPEYFSTNNLLEFLNYTLYNQENNDILKKYNLLK